MPRGRFRCAAARMLTANEGHFCPPNEGLLQLSQLICAGGRVLGQSYPRSGSHLSSRKRHSAPEKDEERRLSEASVASYSRLTSASRPCLRSSSQNARRFFFTAHAACVMLP